MGSSRCTRCGQPAAAGRHRMSPQDAQKYPHAHCPKCGGGSEEGRPTCVAERIGYYVCSCGVTWSEPLPSPS